MGKRAPKVDYEQEIKAYLWKVAAMRRAMGANVPHEGFDYYYSCYEDFFFRNGRWFKPNEQDKYRQREHGQCYQNAFTLLVENEKELRYCEGYATTSASPVYHCWNLGQEDRVVDVTWVFGDPNEKGKPLGYIGVCFPTELALAHVNTAPHYALLDDPANGWPLLRTQYDPEALLTSIRGNRPERASNLRAYRKTWGTQ